MARLPDVPIDDYRDFMERSVSDFADKLRGTFEFERRAEELRHSLPFDFGMPGGVDPQTELDDLMAQEQRMAAERQRELEAEQLRQAAEQQRLALEQQQALDDDISQQAQSAMENRVAQAVQQPQVQDFLSYADSRLDQFAQPPAAPPATTSQAQEFEQFADQRLDQFASGGMPDVGNAPLPVEGRSTTPDNVSSATTESATAPTSNDDPVDRALRSMGIGAQPDMGGGGLSPDSMVDRSPPPPAEPVESLPPPPSPPADPVQRIIGALGEGFNALGQRLQEALTPDRSGFEQAARDIQERQRTLPGTPEAEALSEEPLPLDRVGSAVGGAWESSQETPELLRMVGAETLEQARERDANPVTDTLRRARNVGFNTVMGNLPAEAINEVADEYGANPKVSVPVMGEMGVGDVVAGALPGGGARTFTRYGENAAERAIQRGISAVRNRLPTRAASDDPVNRALGALGIVSREQAGEAGHGIRTGVDDAGRPFLEPDTMPETLDRITSDPLYLKMGDARRHTGVGMDPKKAAALAAQEQDDFVLLRRYGLSGAEAYDLATGLPTNDAIRGAATIRRWNIPVAGPLEQTVADLADAPLGRAMASEPSSVVYELPTEERLAQRYELLSAERRSAVLNLMDKGYSREEAERIIGPVERERISPEYRRWYDEGGRGEPPRAMGAGSSVPLDAGPESATRGRLAEDLSGVAPSPRPIVQGIARGAVQGAVAGGYEASQKEGAGPLDIGRGALLGAAEGAALGGARRAIGRGGVEQVARAVEQSAEHNPRRTTAFDPQDPNIRYELEHRVVDLRELIPSHTDTLEPNRDFPSELQPRLRERAASQAQIHRIATKLNPDSLIFDARRIESGSPIVNADNIVESGNGRVLGLRAAAMRNPEAWQRYRETLAREAPKYGIDPHEIEGLEYPVLVRELVDDVEPTDFVRRANFDPTARSSGYESARQDARLVSDEMLQGLTVSATQSIDQAIQSAANRDVLRRFVQQLPENELDTMVDATGSLSEQGRQRFKAALLVRAYGGGDAGERMAKAMVESIDPGVKNLETAIYGSLPQLARSEAVLRGTDLSIAQDIAKATDVYAILKKEGIGVQDYLRQDSMWERETTAAQDALIEAFEANKRSANRLRDVLEGYAQRAEEQGNPNQGDLFGEAVPRATKEELLNASIRDFGTIPEEAPIAAGSGAAGQGLDNGQPRRRIRPAPATGAAAQEGSLLEPLVTDADRRLYRRPIIDSDDVNNVRELRPRFHGPYDPGNIPGQRPINLTTDEELARLRPDLVPDEVWDEMKDAAQRGGFFHAQRRGVLPDETVAKLADAEARSVSDWIQQGKVGKAYNAEQSLALGHMAASQAAVVRDLGTQIATQTARRGAADDKLVARWMLEGERLQGIMRVAEGAKAEAGRALRSYGQYRKLLDLEPDQAVQLIMKDFGGSKDKQLQWIGEYQRLIDAGAGPRELAAFWRGIKQPTLWDRINVVRYGAMLSSTATHLTNIFGNVGQIAGQPLTTALAIPADMLQSMKTGQRTRYDSEIPQMMRGWVEGAVVGYQDALSTLKTGVNPRDLNKLETMRAGFNSGSGKLDFVIESPLRMLAAADAFFRQTAMGGQVRAIAERTAIQEGLTGAAKAQRVQDIVENVVLFPKVLTEAQDAAARATLQENRKELAGIYQIRQHPAMSLILPFVRTPYNIAAQGLGMTPAGFAAAVKAANDGNQGEAADRAARALFGTAVMGGAVAMAQADMLTGPYPDDAAARSTLPPGWQPWSFKRKNADGTTTYIGFNNLGPISVPLSLAVMGVDAVKQGADPMKIATVGVSGILKFMSDQSFLRGVADFSGLVTDFENKSERIAEGLAGQFMPFAAFQSQVQRSRGIPARDPAGAYEAFIARSLGSEMVPARTTPLGDPVVSQQQGIGAFVSPLRYDSGRDEPALEMFRDADVPISNAPKQLNVSGLTVPLTREEQARFKAMVGEGIRKHTAATLRGKDSKAMKPEVREALAEDIKRTAREEAVGKFIRQVGAAEIRRRGRETAAAGRT